MSRVDTAANALIGDAGLVRPPIDVYALAESLGVQVVQTRMNPGVSGMLIRDNDALTVGLNKDQAPRRQRFTLAHELGHLRLHRGRPLIVDSLVRVNMRDSTSAMATDREEIEANRFAAALLMPEAAVRTAVADADPRRLKSLPKHLADLFDVSAEAMGYRLINLGITS